MRLALTLLIALAGSTNASSLPTIPQISSYNIPSIAYKMISKLVSWTDTKNVGTFKATDVAIGIDGVYAIDTSYAVWNYSTLTGAKSTTWNKHGLTASKIVPLITGDLAYINSTNSYPYLTVSGVTLSMGNATFTATDLSVSLAVTPYIITGTNKIWVYVLTSLIWQVVPITEITAASTYPVSISVDVNENLWIVDHATNVWK